MATRTFGMMAGNWNSAGSWIESAVPTAADDVVFMNMSANCTVNVSASCRSINCDGYNGTLTFSSGVNIGDGTAGSGNVALKFSTGMTVAGTATITFQSTNATQQTITSNGKTFPGNVTFDSTSNGNYQLVDAMNCGSNVITLTKGTLDTNGQTVTAGEFNTSNSNVRSLTLGASTLNLSATNGWNAPITTNLTLSAASSTINCTGASARFHGGGKTYGTVTLTGMSGSPQIVGANTYTTLTLANTAGKTAVLSVTDDQTVTGTFTATGNSKTNRLHIKSSSQGTAVTISAGTVSVNGCDLSDITGSGAGSWDLSGASNYTGDCGGNTGITFTTAAAQTWSGTTGGDWSANAWSGRVPLPQDDVSIASAFTGSQTIAIDMPRAGKSVSLVGSTGNLTLSTSTATIYYGSLTLISGVTLSGSLQWTFAGRGSYTLTTAGKTITNNIIFDPTNGTLTLGDALVVTNTIAVTSGTFDTGNYNLTSTTFSSTTALNRTITLGSSTLTLTSTGTVFNLSQNTGLTVTANTAVIHVTDTGSSSKTVSVTGNKAYGELRFTTGGTGAIIITGTGTFTRISKSGTGTKTITMPGSTTTTLTGTTPLPSGTAGNLITIASSGGSATVSCANNVDCEYLSLTNIVAAGTTPFYAGTTSTNGGGNTNWSFTARSGGLPVLMNHYRQMWS